VSGDAVSDRAELSDIDRRTIGDQSRRGLGFNVLALRPR
jgi:hypothetical protein